MNGSKDDALRIAKFAAEVYSYRGLEAAAQLMEQLGDFAKAAEYYSAINERYEDDGPLNAYFMRNKDRDKAIAAQFDATVKKAFPKGLNKALVSEFTGPPVAGVSFTSESPQTKQFGIKVGDVIVALDGYRVDTFPQYKFVRGLKPNGPLELIY